MESFDVRLDHQFSTMNRIFVRHSFQNTTADIPSLFGLPLGGPPTGAGTTFARNQNTGIGHTYQFTSALINEIRVGLNRQSTTLQQEDYGQNISSQLGIPGCEPQPADIGAGRIGGYRMFTAGEAC